ncbi:MAG: transglutaminase-like cysteine peptidase [Aestuariivirga sp.]
MRLFKLFAAVAVTVAFLPSEDARPASPAPKSQAAEYGNALPPIGFVRFCAANPAECKGRDRRAARIDMTSEQWQTVYQVNSYVNGKIAPVSDQDLYGKPEHWTYPTDAGDCEDYLLLKKRYLESMGFAPQALLITVVLDEKNEGHAVLTLAAKDGDYVLDNRRNDVLRWTDTDYAFLKRQSQQDATKWVALAPRPGRQTDTVAGNKK